MSHAALNVRSGIRICSDGRMTSCAGRSEKENALFLNPKSDLLDDYLQYCEESEEI